MSRILLGEDHERLARLMCQGLEATGIAVDVAGRIDSAWAAVQQISYQALVPDRGLPDGDGLSLLHKLRKAGLGVPCLVLTARDALHDWVQGLDAGALRIGATMAQASAWRSARRLPWRTAGNSWQSRPNRGCGSGCRSGPRFSDRRVL